MRKVQPGLGCVSYNLGTGTGTTVLEMVNVRRGQGARASGGRSSRR